VNRRRRTIATSRRGLTVVELMIGIVVTALVGLGVASMLTMVADASASARDGRSALMRGNLAQNRLRTYFEPSLCVLAIDPAQGVALWLQDDTPGQTVNLLELRIMWYDAAAGRISVERVQFPETWTPVMVDAANITLPKTADFFAAMLAQRQAGYTVTDTLMESVSSFTATGNGPALQSSDRVDVALTLTSDAGDAVPLLMTAGLPSHTEPAS